MKFQRLLTIILLACALTSSVVASELQAILEKMATGEYEKAEEQVRTQLKDRPEGLRLLIELARRRGALQEADDVAHRLVGLYHQRLLSTPADLGHAAFAAWHLGQWDLANQIFIQASESGNAPKTLFVDWANLYLEKYNPAEAESILHDALKAPALVERWTEADIHLGLARAIKEQGKPGDEQVLETASKLEPNNPRLLAYKSRAALVASNWDSARALILRGLKHNPHHLELLELQTALHYFQGDVPAYREARARVLNVNPRDAALFELLGDLSVTQRRLEEAVSFYDRSLELEPDRWSALASKGMNLLRLGEEAAGREALERAYQNDPYNLWTVNTLRLLDSFDRFERFETDHFRIMLHRDEATALRPYVENLLERALTELQRRYQHSIEEKIVFEMYPDHADFAVRTLGLPGLGALGATFGRVVAMDSPSARPRGEFHWASTLWHEVAHVVTLSLSQSRVARWFTEGLSMMEERRGGAGWGDHLNPNFVRAYKEDRLLPLSDLDSGFVRPRFPGQVEISYFQAGWLCDFLAERYGMETIRAMLLAYGEGHTTAEVFSQVLGKEAAALDAEFREELKRVLDPLVDRVGEPELVDKSLSGLEMSINANPENYSLRMLYGHQLLEAGQLEEAADQFRSAIELFPTAAGKSSPYRYLAEIYDQQGKEDALLQILEKWWHHSPLLNSTAVRLAELHSQRGEIQKAIGYLEESMFTNPLTPENHLQLGDLYLQVERYQGAVQEFRVALSLNPVDEANTRYRLARALLGTGEKQEARREILKSLEIAPGYESAQQLLLEIVRQ